MAGRDWLAPVSSDRPPTAGDRMPAYLIRFLTRCIRGCLHPRACGCTLSHPAKVFVPCNEPPPPGFLLPLRLRHPPAPSKIPPSISPCSSHPPSPFHTDATATDRRWSGVPEQARGARKAPGGERTDDSTYYTFVRAARAGRKWGRQAGIAAVAHG